MENMFGNSGSQVNTNFGANIKVLYGNALRTTYFFGAKGAQTAVQKDILLIRIPYAYGVDRISMTAQR